MLRKLSRNSKRICVGTCLCILVCIIYALFSGYFEKPYQLSQRQPYFKRGEKYNWNYFGSFELEYEQFAPALNDTEVSWYMELLSVFQNRCQEFNLRYFLDSGSVLGAYSFHGFIPWDDDVDIRMLHQDRYLRRT